MRGRSRLSVWPGLWLAAMALAVRMVVPLGFMPAPAGGVALVACPEAMPSARAKMPMTHAMAGMGQHEHDPAHPDHRCPFGAVSAAAALAAPVPLLLAAAPPVPVPLARFVLDIVPGRGLAAPPPPPTGPPLLLR